MIIDRDKTATRPEDERRGSSLALLGGGFVNYFSMSGRSYKVIRRCSSATAQSAAIARLLHPHGRRHAGAAVTIATVTIAMPESSITSAAQQRQIVGVACRRGPGRAKFLQDRGARCPKAIRSLPAWRNMPETPGFIATFGFALIIIFPGLAALFEASAIR